MEVEVWEFISFYKQQTHITESNTLLTISNISDVISGESCNGKRMNGPVTNFVDIDTSATSVMVTNKYLNTSSFTIRAGGKSTGNSSATNRMYSISFKGFTYQSPVQGLLPLTVVNWNTVYNNNAVTLKWSTSFEQNASHFMIERSFNGIEYTTIGILDQRVTGILYTIIFIMIK